ncbi:uncharacterized protein LOC125217011 [Salvia hispanica]|uniref:uncharacterized protein LOC125217011 n=1 Tax=Salvia hispanica TaxID=49212 RepID=UPI0020095409|nr:uncharacterized protein LOC125217011 [Salvia hispanica]
MLPEIKGFLPEPWNIMLLHCVCHIFGLWRLSLCNHRSLQQFLEPSFERGMLNISIGWLTISWACLLHSGNWNAFTWLIQYWCHSIALVPYIRFCSSVFNLLAFDESNSKSEETDENSNKKAN